MIEGKSIINTHVVGQTNKIDPQDESEWTCRDLNPRPPPCQGGDLPS